MCVMMPNRTRDLTHSGRYPSFVKIPIRLRRQGSTFSSEQMFVDADVRKHHKVASPRATHGSTRLSNALAVQCSIPLIVLWTPGMS